MKKYAFIVIGAIIGTILWFILLGNVFFGVSAQTVCNPFHSDKPYINTGMEFNHGTCTVGSAGTFGCQGGSCSSGSGAHGGHISTVPYRCGTIAHAGGVKHNNAYMSACGQETLSNGATPGGNCSCNCDSDGENCSTCTNYVSGCTFTNYYEESYGASHNYQSDWQADIGTQHGCKVPAKNSSCFANSPQKDANQTEKAAGQEIDGCGSGTYGSPNGCDQKICNDTAVNHTKQSCLKARDGKFKCGGVAACGEDICEKDYVSPKPGLWGDRFGRRFYYAKLRLKKRYLSDL